MGVCEQDENVDEIKRFLDARYFSASECCWRIFDMSLHKQSPTVKRLSVHLNNKQMIYYNEKDNIQDILNLNVHTTTLIAWFEMNKKEFECS